MRISAQHSLRREGKIIVLVAVSMIGVLSFVALSLDGGMLLSERREAQNAADAAAAAAANDVFYNYWSESGWDSSGTGEAAAYKIAAENGYQNDGVESRVEVYIPPISGDYTGKPGYAEVIVRKYLPRSFSNLFADGTMEVSARAVAIGAPIAADVGILVLDPSSKGAFTTSGGGNSIVEGTPILINSSHSEGSIVGGSGYVKAMEFGLVGNYTTTGGGTLLGPVQLGREPTEDPLTWVPEPDPTTLTVQSTKAIQYTSGTHTLQPGVYVGGISASGTASLILEPGVYYMDGGGFTFTGQGSLYGDGVMIYNDPMQGQSAGITVSGQGSIYLTPMDYGVYQGLTFFQRRDSNATASISGEGEDTYIEGTFYFPGALLNVTGNGTSQFLGSQYISWQLKLGGNGDIHISWAPDRVARRRTITIVE